MSLINLLDDSNNQDISYILTRKFNQNVEKNVFNVLKGIADSAGNNITLLDFKHW